MTRVLVINPPNQPFTSQSLLIEPIDVLTVASYVRSLGHEVKLVDMDVNQIAPDQFESLLASFNPTCLVIPFDYHIPLFTAAAISGVLEIIRQAITAGIKVAVGGRPATFSSSQFLRDPNTVVILGEMEPALCELLSLAEWKPSILTEVRGIRFLADGRIIATPVRKELLDLDTLPIPDRSLLNLTPYIDVRTMLTSRGCVEKCSFCPVHRFWGRWRRRSKDLVVDEIELLAKEYGAKKILFLDDHATVNDKRIREICSEILKREIKVSLGCLGTIACHRAQTAELMYKAGFRWIHFGAEFGTQQVLDGINKRTTIEQIAAAVAESKAAGLRVRTSWIFDAPGADLPGLDATVNLISEIEPHEVRAHFLALRAGAPLNDDRPESRQSLAEQYIHSGAPHADVCGLSRESIEHSLSVLTSELGLRGYHIIRDSAEYASVPDSPSTRFISFCPGRYGIGWQQ